jgi:hypothetical protein
MGWASGSGLLGDIILSTKKVVPVKHRKELYKLFIDHFESYDCDTVCECIGLDKQFDLAMQELYPDGEFQQDE